MSYFVVQLGSAHKPHGPFWTGQRWGPEETRAYYETDEAAIEQAVIAVKSASRDVAVLSGDCVIFRRKPAQRGAYYADAGSFSDKKV